MQIVNKGWGRELIIENNDKYCGKLLVYDKAGSKGSMHFHLKKHETFYVQKGKFKIHWIETKDASIQHNILKEGDTWTNEPGEPHQLEALEDDSVVFEISTTHYDNDDFRIMPGDSQK
jgi:quercetin dioxygenase-like cupin family protein